MFDSRKITYIFLFELIKHCDIWNARLRKSDVFTNILPSLMSVVDPGQESVQKNRWS